MRIVRSGISNEEIGVVLCVLLIIAVIVAGPGVRAFGGLNIEYSNGTRSGVVQKISKKGVIWSTWEGELNLGYSRSSSDGNGNVQINPEIFYFSCSSDEIAKQVVDAEKSGKRCTLSYTQYIARGYKYGGTSYDVTGVE